MSETLKAACDAALSNPAFKPSDGVTHCNQAAISIANAMGCHELDGLLADDQYKVIGKNESGCWKSVKPFEATIHALGNQLAVAILPSYRIIEGLDDNDKPIYAKHGHIAVVYPLGMQWSGRLMHDVPMLANVGRTVGVMKASMAFPVASGDAYYYAWSPNGKESGPSA